MKSINFGELEMHECNAQEWAELTGMECCVKCVETRTGKSIKTVWVATGFDNIYSEGQLEVEDVCWASATGMQFTDGSYACLDCYVGHAGLCKFKELMLLNTQLETFMWMFNKANFIG